MKLVRKNGVPLKKEYCQFNITSAAQDYFTDLTDEYLRKSGSYSIHTEQFLIPFAFLSPSPYFLSLKLAKPHL